MCLIASPVEVILHAGSNPALGVKDTLQQIIKKITSEDCVYKSILACKKMQTAVI